MNSITATLESVGDELLGVVDELFVGSRTLSEPEVMEVMAAAARIVRAGEALLVEAAGQVCDRSDGRLRADRMTTRFGCRSASELVQRVTRVSKQRAADLVKAGRAVMQAVALTSGEVLPAALPGMRGALATGEVGVDGVVAVAGPLLSCHVGTAAIFTADMELAATACGEGPDAAPPPCAEDLRAMATVWAMYLDQDGAEPREARAMRKRGFTLGVCRDGLHPVRGHVLPEVAAQLQRAFDSILNPKVDGAVAPAGPHFVDATGSSVDPSEPDAPSPAMADNRSRAQKQHDALATVLTVIAASGSLPQLGGAAPTLVVSVRAEDLASGRGFAHLSGTDEPISLAAARHVACSGAVQRVESDHTGRIVSLGTPERVFGHHLRRAITLRDGGCLIPGCHVPAEWCEIHHVPRRTHAHRQRGPPLLAPPPHPRQQRLDDPHEPRSTRNQGPLLVGREAEMETRHQVPGPDARTRHPKDMKPQQSPSRMPESPSP
jgi:hypothetical protein